MSVSTLIYIYIYIHVHVNLLKIENTHSVKVNIVRTVIKITKECVLRKPCHLKHEINLYTVWYC